MTSFEVYRSKHLCVPGGTIQVKPRCTCLVQDADNSMIAFTRVEDGVAWNYYKFCAVHPDTRQIRPVDTSETATVAAAAVQVRAMETV